MFILNVVSCIPKVGRHTTVDIWNCKTDPIFRAQSSLVFTLPQREKNEEIIGNIWGYEDSATLS